MSTELFLAIAGTVIALSVALTTIWQGFLSRRHNRLTVKPILRIDRETIEGTPVKMVLMNTGVGPAIVKAVKFYVDGTLIDENAISPGSLAIEGIGLNPTKFRVFEIFPEESLSAGERQALFQSLDAISDNANLALIKNAFDRLSFVVEYESVYKEKFNMTNPVKQNPK